MNIYTTLDPETLEQPELHRCLLAAIAPRPICLASSINTQGEINLSPFSYFNIFSSNPPIVIFSPARRGTDNQTKHTLENAKEIPEIVVNVVNHAMVEQTSLSSIAFDKGVNEFEKSGLTPVESQIVKPPRVGEAPISLECLVEQILPLGEGPGAGNLIICRVILIHLQNEFLDEKGQLDSHRLDLVGRMGHQWYVRASGEALFPLEKPQKEGIGVDQLPESIRRSSVLTGNELGRLGQQTHLPKANEIKALHHSPAIQKISFKGSPENQIKKLHQMAQKVMKNGKYQEALRILLFADQL